MFNFLIKIWRLPDLRTKALLTIGILILTRFIAHVPLPGVDIRQLSQFFSQNQLFGLLDLFSGGTLSNFSIMLMGVGPYITASIVVQLMGYVVPSLEALQKEGEFGRKKLTQYTRLLTVPMAILQGIGTLLLFRQQGILPEWDGIQIATMLAVTTATTMLLMWLGEIISENGVGNGISMLIALGIVSGLPTQVRNTLAVVDTGKIFGLLVFAAIGILTVAAIVFITQGERQIPVTYARRVRGQRSWAGVNTHIPLKVNSAGVIPIIFALSMLIFPTVIARFFALAKTEWIANAANALTRILENQIVYGVLYFILVFAFTFFYTFVVFQPPQVAENLQKQGGFIPGIRPGNETSSYLRTTLIRITTLGGLFIALVAVLPFIVQSLTKIQTLVLGGTSILILVSVIIETTRSIKAQVVMRTYDTFS
jgi:preprotein translocase subunit SecY